MKTIPMFPLSILPLPGELVPLHIFEPRYRQLLVDAETDDFSFGIFFNHIMNAEKIGSLMKLESVIKRYPTGESDIVVKCYDIFKMDMLYRTFENKMYPGGDVAFWNIHESKAGGSELSDLFQEFLIRKNTKRTPLQTDIFAIAQELNLDIAERYQFLMHTASARDRFLILKIRYLIALLKKEEESRDVYHLN
jgi:Lon protease-like protein